MTKDGTTRFLAFYYHDLDLDLNPMTSKYEPEVSITKVYLLTENELSTQTDACHALSLSLSLSTGTVRR